MFLPVDHLTPSALKFPQARFSILVPAARRFLVPLPRLGEVRPKPAHADLGVVPHRKLGTREPAPCRLLRKDDRERLVLVEPSLAGGTAKEPLGERHVRLELARLARERVVLHAHQRIEAKRRGGVFVRVTKLGLRRRKVEVSRALEVLARLEGGGGAHGDELGDDLRRDARSGELAEEEERIDVRRLRDIDSREHRRALEETNRRLRVRRCDAQLALEVRHAEAVEAAPNAITHPALEAVPRARDIAHRLVIAPKLEPRGRVPRTCSGFKVPERVARGGREDGWEHA